MADGLVGFFQHADQILVLRCRRLRGIPGSIGGAGLESELLRFRAGKLEGKSDDLVGDLAIVIQENSVTGFTDELLLGGQLPVPDDALVEEGQDVVWAGSGGVAQERTAGG